MSDAILFDAIEFATNAHKGQLRKGSRLPYIYHPLAVGRILLEAGYETDIVIGGILHDTVEDTQVTIEEIASLFGERVAALVAGASEKNKADTWENRKRETIEKLDTADLGVCAVSCADKLDNIRSIRADIDVIGEEVWKRFKRSKESQKWYYTRLVPVFERRLTGEPHASLAALFRLETEKVFGRSNG
jgi:(p)ppGpp synthase/HD superfamily hydrolase